jgi:hypothetical protein
MRSGLKRPITPVLKQRSDGPITPDPACARPCAHLPGMDVLRNGCWRVLGKIPSGRWFCLDRDARMWGLICAGDARITLFCRPPLPRRDLAPSDTYPTFCDGSLGGWAPHQPAPPKPTPRTQITVAGPSRSGRSHWQRGAQLLARLRVWAGAASVTPPPPGRSAWQPHVTPFV